MTNCKIGLLPLYLALYDRACPELRPRIDAFAAAVADRLGRAGLDVYPAPVCRVREEFERAVDGFIARDVAAVVTVHLAYSPSLEAIDPLCRLDVPLIMLDTTPAPAFGPDTPPEEIMYNHGIHGVQDLCNLLTRRGRPYFVVAGAFDDSDVMERAAALCRAAGAARRLRTARVGLVGRPFEGMGDFSLPFDEMERALGIQVLPLSDDELARCAAGVTPEDVAAEMAADRRDFDVAPGCQAAHERSARVGLALRRWAEEARLTALTVNFMATSAASSLSAMPFVEAGRAMAAGLGYAGEGDALTAAFVGALMALTPDTTFTEMFCPDWRGGTVFLSHMGEINPRVVEGRPLLGEKDFPYTDAGNPVALSGCLKAGAGALVNLAPLGDGRFRLVLAEGDVVSPPGPDALAGSVRGWFRPRRPLAGFLEGYSQAGGTHHLALCYGKGLAEPLAALAALLGWDFAAL